MNRSGKYQSFPLPALGLGLVAMALRTALYRQASGEYGLLTAGHPLSTALWIVTWISLVVIVLTARKHTSPDVTGPDSSPMVAFGCFLAAAGIAASTLLNSALTAGIPGLLWKGMGIAAPVALVVAGGSYQLGKRPNFLCHLIPSLFFLCHIIDHYRSWSSNPQMMDYVFALLACMSLALFCFYCACRDVGLGNRSIRTGAGLAAIFFTTAELSSGLSSLYLGSLFWVLVILCSPETATPPEEQPAEEPASEVASDDPA